MESDDDDDDMLLAAILLCRYYLLHIKPQEPTQKIKRTRNVHPRPDYKGSVWWLMLQRDDLLSDQQTREYRQFRRRFGLPYSEFAKVVTLAKSWGIVSAKEVDAVGRKAVPLPLKVLGALRVLCKGCAYDAVSELTGMGLSTMAAFFTKFIKRFRDELLAEWVRYPKTFDDAGSLLRAGHVAGWNMERGKKKKKKTSGR